MAFMRRIFLFLVVNALVVLTISVVTNVLGIRPYLNAYGIDYGALAVFCCLWGMIGSLVSLMLSRVMAKMAYGVQVIPENAADPDLRSLVQLIHELAARAQLPAMPEVGIYNSQELNAFATGPSKSKALVAVSTGLLRSMNQAELKGVLGHEITHIANGDMVTMTLIQGVVNAFVMFFSRVLAFALTTRGNNEQEGSYRPSFIYYLVQMVIEILLTCLGSIVVAWFSRWREYRADKGGAQLAGKESMINALEVLQQAYGRVVDPRQEALSTLKISGRPGSFLALFASHPPLDERIARLRDMRN